MQDNKFTSHSPASYNIMMDQNQASYRHESRAGSLMGISKSHMRDLGYSADESLAVPTSSHTSSKKSDAFSKGRSFSLKTNPWNSNKDPFPEKKFLNEIVSSDEERLCGETKTIAPNQSTIKFINGLPTVVKRDKSAKFHCISCGYEGQTNLKYEYGSSLITILVIFFFVLFWPCLIYFACSNRWKDIVHYCPKCNGLIGKKKFVMSAAE